VLAGEKDIHEAGGRVWRAASWWPGTAVCDLCRLPARLHRPCRASRPQPRGAGPACAGEREGRRHAKGQEGPERPT
jgi:hypothetical protein